MTMMKDRHVSDHGKIRHEADQLKVFVEDRATGVPKDGGRRVADE